MKEYETIKQLVASIEVCTENIVGYKNKKIWNRCGGSLQMAIKK